MRIKSLLVALTITLAACSGDHSSVDNDAVPATTAQTAKPTKSKAPKMSAGIDQVLAAMGKDMKLDVSYDRIAHKTDGSQRQVFIEVAGATDREDQAAVAKAFTAQGFKVYQGKDDQNGIRMSFKKTGVNEIHALIRNKGVGPSLKNPDGTSSIYLRQISLK